LRTGLIRFGGCLNAKDPGFLVSGMSGLEGEVRLREYCV
jgi:hypothetical protein